MSLSGDDDEKWLTSEITAILGSKVPGPNDRRFMIAINHVRELRRERKKAGREVVSNVKVVTHDRVESDAGSVPSIIVNCVDFSDLLGLDPSDLAPEYDCDLTCIPTETIDYEELYKRGDFEYYCPYGWRRFALDVKMKYGANDTWLGPNTFRTESSPGEWPVCYHGTSYGNLRSIIREGFDPLLCKNKLYGPGIYSSQDPRAAAHYSVPFECNGKTYEVALECKVNPEIHAKQCEEEDNEYGQHNDPYSGYSMVLIDNYFHYVRCPRHDPSRNCYDIRPCAILIREHEDNI